MVETVPVEYDRTTQVSLVTENGLVGSVTQDVVTHPAEKMLRVQGEEGFLEWYANYNDSNDAVIYGNHRGLKKVEKFQKVRADDFVGEIDHVEKLLEGAIIDSPISLERGLDTMLVVGAAHKSSKERKSIRIPNSGFNLY